MEGIIKICNFSLNLTMCANSYAVGESSHSLKPFFDPFNDTKIFSKPFLMVKGGLGKVLQTKMFKNGEISIQNPASAAVVDCLNVKRGDFVIDVCAAPGTKSLYLSSLVGDSGKILASDVIAERVEMGKRLSLIHI